MLPARHRLTRPADISAVLRAARGRDGARTGSRLLTVHVKRTPARAGDPARVGFVVSKAVGNAVVRNRTKRVLRALMAARVSRLTSATDLIVRANPAVTAVPTAEVAADLDRLLSAAVRRLGSVPG